MPQLLKASRANTAATASAIHLPLPPFLAAAVAAAAPPATAAPALPKPLKRLFKPPKMPLRLPMPKADYVFNAGETIIVFGHKDDVNRLINTV